MKQKTCYLYPFVGYDTVGGSVNRAQFGQPISGASNPQYDQLGTFQGQTYDQVRPSASQGYDSVGGSQQTYDQVGSSAQQHAYDFSGSGQYDQVGGGQPGSYDTVASRPTQPGSYDTVASRPTQPRIQQQNAYDQMTLQGSNTYDSVGPGQQALQTYDQVGSNSTLMYDQVGGSQQQNTTQMYDSFGRLSTYDTVAGPSTGGDYDSVQSPTYDLAANRTKPAGLYDVAAPDQPPLPPRKR